MAAVGTKVRPELALAQQIIGKQGNLKAALSLAERGARLYPEFRWPTTDDSEGPSFAAVAAGLRSKLGASAPAPEVAAVQEEKPAPKKTVPARKSARPAARKAAAAKPVAEPVVAEPVVAEPVVAEPVVAEPVKPAVQTVTLRLVHDGERQTSIFGVEKGSPAQQAIGSAKRGGLGWMYWPAGDCFYLSKTQGYAPDMDRIGEAVQRLESLRDEASGVQLYRVEQEIATTGADGKPLPKRMDARQAAVWQRAYTAAKNAMWAQLGVSRGECAECGAAGLDQRTGRIGKGDDNMPQIECVTCEAFAPAAPEHAPEVEQAAPVDLAALTLALPAAQESEECPACHKMVGVVDGKFALHTGRTGNGACRGRRGVPVVDVEAEPAPEPVRTAARRKATADVGMAGASASGLVMRFALQSGLSSTAGKNAATEVRQAISRKITYGRQFKGVKIEVRRDKVTRQLLLTVTEGGAGYAADALSAELARVVKSVRGVGNQVHKTTQS